MPQPEVVDDVARHRESDRLTVDHLWDQARESVKYDYYFGDRTAAVTRWNRIGEIIVAITAPGSVLSGLTLWNLMIGTFPVGAVLWAGLGTIAGFVGLNKPIIRPDASIERYTKLYTEYRALAGSHKAIIRSIQVRGSVDAEIQERLDRLAERVETVGQSRPPKLKDRLLKRYAEKALEEISDPPEWLPEA